ncbi:MAG: serine hydrolase domain-containing protein [Pyrinomonadaceae bacterium]
MKNRFIVSLFILITLAFNAVNPLTANAKDLGNLPENMTFDVNKFESYLHSKLDNNTVGFAFTVNQGGQYLRGGNFGYAVLKKDDPSILDAIGFPLTTETRMNIASVTKTITATAVLKTIQDKKAVGYPNLTTKSKVEIFLPPNWERGKGVKDLTFKELMSQYSGMFDNGGFTNVSALRAWIKSGVTRLKTDYKYINGNLAIFRIILPYMLATETTRNQWNTLAANDEKKFNTVVSNRFKEIVRELVFTPAGIKNVDMKDGSEIPTRWYNKNNNASGYVEPDWTETGGGGGWFMSTTELARFMAYLRFSDKLLTPATRKEMDDNMLGWEDPAFWTQFQGKYGSYLGHGGLLNYGTAKPETTVGMVSLVVNYPSGIQGILMVNSLGNYPNKAQLMSDAFDAAVVVKQVKTK